MPKAGHKENKTLKSCHCFSIEVSQSGTEYATQYK